MAYRYSVRKGVERIKTKTFIAILAFGLLLGGGAMSLAVFGSAYAVAPETVYSALPSTSPATSYPSQPFQAQQTSEFGDYVHLGGTARNLNTVTATMVTWARYSEYQSNAAYNSSGWSHPITLTVYSSHLGSDGAPDTVLAQKTQTINIPWRPEGDPTCADDGYGAGFSWKDAGGICRHGLAFNAVFDMSSPNVTLPNDVIIGIAYNTETYGVTPLGINGPYNSLNVAVPPSQPVSVGSDDSTTKVFWNTSTAGWYTDGGASGVGIFREDTNWGVYGTVALQITATPDLVAPPTSKDQCKKDGWKVYNNPSFKNQGQCEKYVEHHKVKIDGKVSYNAYGLDRTAEFKIDSTKLNTNKKDKDLFKYSDVNGDWYVVEVQSVNGTGKTGYFAGVVTSASNPSWVGNWLFGKAVENHPDQVWGSFTTQTAAMDGVDNMTNPGDGPFTVTKGHVDVDTKL